MDNRTRMRMMEYARGKEEPESRNRRRYSNGRYAPQSYAEDILPERYEDEPYARGGSYRMENHYGGKQKSMRVMGDIGFHEEPEEGMPWEVAQEWVHSMEFPEGGPKWKFEQVESLLQKHKVDCNPVEMWAVMNALYSDYGKVFRKFGVDSVNLYMELAKAWIEDEDAVEDKAMVYYECIVAK